MYFVMGSKPEGRVNGRLLEMKEEMKGMIASITGIRRFSKGDAIARQALERNE